MVFPVNEPVLAQSVFEDLTAHGLASVCTNEGRDSPSRAAALPELPGPSSGVAWGGRAIPEARGCARRTGGYRGELAGAAEAHPSTLGFRGSSLSWMSACFDRYARSWPESSANSRRRTRGLVPTTTARSPASSAITSPASKSPGNATLPAVAALLLSLRPATMNRHLSTSADLLDPSGEGARLRGATKPLEIGLDGLSPRLPSSDGGTLDVRVRLLEVPHVRRRVDAQGLAVDPDHDVEAVFVGEDVAGLEVVGAPDFDPGLLDELLPVAELVAGFGAEHLELCLVFTGGRALWNESAPVWRSLAGERDLKAAKLGLDLFNAALREVGVFAVLGCAGGWPPRACSVAPIRLLRLKDFRWPRSIFLQVSAMAFLAVVADEDGLTEGNEARDLFGCGVGGCGLGLLLVGGLRVDPHVLRIARPTPFHALASA